MAYGTGRTPSPPILLKWELGNGRLTLSTHSRDLISGILTCDLPCTRYAICCTTPDAVTIVPIAFTLRNVRWDHPLDRICQHVYDLSRRLLRAPRVAGAICRPVNPAESYDPFIRMHHREDRTEICRTIQRCFCQSLPQQLIGRQSVLGDMCLEVEVGGIGLSTKWLMNEE